MIYDINGVALAAGQAEPAKKWKDNGVLDSLSITKLFCDIPWKPTNSGMPKRSGGNFTNGETIIGLPYSSASMEDGYVGNSISLYTFMTAVHNPKSVLYNEESKGYTGSSYYGTVCTSLVCSAWGLPCIITTVAMRKVDFIVAKDKSEIELGDMLLSSTHAKLVTGIKRDSNGDITYVRVSESTDDHCVENTYTSYASFLSSHTAYTVYRYKQIDAVDSYEPSQFFALSDEEPLPVKYSDIVTYYGDRITRKKGTDIPINVLDSVGYNTIKVYHDGELVDTKTTIADFTISAPDVGQWEVRMTGVNKEADTFFDIVDANISISGNTLTFNTTYNATAIGGYPTYTTNSSGKATSWNNPKRVQLVTEEENTAREIDISAFLNDSDCNGGVRLYVKGMYGGVSFEHPYS